MAKNSEKKSLNEILSECQSMQTEIVKLLTLVDKKHGRMTTCLVMEMLESINPLYARNLVSYLTAHVNGQVKPLNTGNNYLDTVLGETLVQSLDTLIRIQRDSKK